MKLSTKLLTLALVLVPAVPALAAAKAATPTITTVARYNFDRGVVGGKVAENSGRGVALKVRAAQGGRARVITSKSGTNRYLAFPAKCTSTTACPRVLLEGGDDLDLDPGTRQFRWGAKLLIPRTQVIDSSNVMQKGVSTSESQWKMQIGATSGKAQCVVVGRGASKAYIVRSKKTVADGAWHSVLCIRNGGVLAIYVDNAKQNQIAIDATVSIGNSSPLRIGGPNLNTTSDFFNGFVDDVYAAVA